MSAADQWRLLQRLRHVLPTLALLAPAPGEERPDFAAIVGGLAPLTNAGDKELDYVSGACRAICEVQEGGEWRPLEALPGMADLLRLIAIIIAENFGPFFAVEHPAFRRVAQDGPQFDPVSLPNGDDWLFRPVLRGLCKAESLYDGTLRIEHLAQLNDALDVMDENDARARKAAERQARNGR